MTVFSVVLILLCWSSAPLGAEIVTTVRASGIGYIASGDQAGALAQAKKAAMREAVEIGVGTLISSETRVDNFSVLEDHILSRTDGYIRSYAILKQGPIDKNTYQVDIEAVVELGNLHNRLDALELLIAHAGNPYILCLGRDEYDYDAERVRDLTATLLRKYLQRKSARFNLAAPLKMEQHLLEQAATLGFEQGADIVVRAESAVREAAGIEVPFAQTSLKGLGLYSATADMRIEALWTDTGEVFASSVHTERAADVNLATAGEKAIRNGMEKMAADMVSRLAENWREKMYSGRLVRLVVKGQIELVNKFENGFSYQVAGVEKLYRRSYDKGIAVFDIRSKDNGFALARDLIAKGIEGMDVDIIRVSPNRVQLEIVN